MDNHFRDATKMADFISREEVLKAILEETSSESVEELADFVATRNLYLDWCGGVLQACQTAQEIPTADVRPVVRARWEDETGYIFNLLAQRVYCPACKSYAYFYPITTKNYCPNCGADMRETGR